jgi:hypothetical protein
MAACLCGHLAPTEVCNLDKKRGERPFLGRDKEGAASRTCLVAFICSAFSVLGGCFRVFLWRVFGFSKVV